MDNPTIVSMPLFFEHGKKEVKRIYINMNVINTLHFHVKGKIKKEYEELAFTKINGWKWKDRIRLEFVLWKKDRRRGDRANVLSMHEKFFCDALTKAGCIVDDDDKYIESTTYRTGGISKDNPRVEIHIHIIDNEPFKNFM